MFDKELSYIKDERIKENAKILIGIIPQYFYKVPASSTGKYHPDFSSGDGGLLRHTKTAVRIAHELLIEDGLYNYKSIEKDLVILALIMHDSFKHGVIESKYTDIRHPLISSEQIRLNKNKLTLTDDELNLLCSMIETHMGPYTTDYNGNEVLEKPKTSLQKFVHLCDLLSSKKFLDIKFSGNEIIN